MVAASMFTTPTVAVSIPNVVTTATSTSENAKHITQLKNLAGKVSKAKTTTTTGVKTCSLTNAQNNQIILAVYHLLDALSKTSESGPGNEAETDRCSRGHQSGCNNRNFC